MSRTRRPWTRPLALIAAVAVVALVVAFTLSGNSPTAPAAAPAVPTITPLPGRGVSLPPNRAQPDVRRHAMPDTTTDATTTPTPEAVGEMLGSALAGIVILNLRAADTGWERGWLYEHALTHPATYPTPPGCVVPEPFTRFDAHAATYRDAWFAGRDDYRADHNLPPLPGRQA